jgi:hypothetical protein|tara:strand:- start:3215 stop:4165 length:951 start_codon:yes stop_codon:yes gene_type:complete
MKISGFSMVKNADKLYFPIKQAIESILPIVDEFVIAIGDCDENDKTVEIVESINSDKVKIIRTVWDLRKYPNGMENAHQTDIAKSHCTGDWLFYLQADEVVHEQYLPIIKARCLELLEDQKVEGLVFNYKHFWGDYWHYSDSHSWYPREIRIVRNRPEIHSWESAQSFRRIPNFDGVFYRQQEGTFRLKVAKVNAYIFHYGWVRPPHLMQQKRKALDTIHKGSQRVAELYQDRGDVFEYGHINQLTDYKDSVPKIMNEWVARFDWKDKLDYKGEHELKRDLFKHEQLRYRVITWVENNILGGRALGGFRNYLLLKR